MSATAAWQPDPYGEASWRLYDGAAWSGQTAPAREALDLAQERFRVGANTFVDVVQSRADYQRAESDRITAIYEFHRAYATLESAVGRPLR